jgi:electron transfer flavoprotein beta subunit
MNLLICVTDVFHPHDLHLPGDGAAGPVGLRMPNRADECAVALARRLAEPSGGRVSLLSVSPPEAEETLEAYLGLGAEALVRVWDSAIERLDALAVAFILSCAVERLRPDLIMCGDRAFGADGTGLTGSALAERLGWPFVGGVVAAEAHQGGEIVVHRLIERGDRQIIRTPLPAVVAVSAEADPPGYPSFARIRGARRERLDLTALGLSADAVREALSPVEVTGWAVAKPRPKKLFTPPSTASAADRLRMVMGGGKARAPQDALVEAPPEKAAEQILQFLRQEGLIPP